MAKTSLDYSHPELCRRVCIAGMQKKALILGQAQLATIIIIIARTEIIPNTLRIG